MDSNLRPEHRQERKVNPVQRRLADISKAYQMLGFKAVLPLNEGLRQLVTWWQEQRIPKGFI
jgi:UDP-glucose 4-epimerase